MMNRIEKMGNIIKRVTKSLKKNKFKFQQGDKKYLKLKQTRTRTELDMYQNRTKTELVLNQN